MKMDETELSLGLGLPGGSSGGCGSGDTVMTSSVGNKRGFSETETMDLKLNLTTKDRMSTSPPLNLIKNNQTAQEVSSKLTPDPSNPPAKAPVVGWPPVRSYRKNVLAVQKSTGESEGETEKAGGRATLVKVSMDGAPYLRKVDLKLYKSYQGMSDALGKMFSSFTLGKYGAQGMIDFMNESKLIDLLNDSDYVPTYEDKDGDWMLVGDVPWEMFVESCKRIRIMKGKEAAGIAPRAMEKCKNRI